MYTSGHMLRTGILRTWNPTQVKSLYSSDSQAKTYSFRRILIVCFLVAIYGKELAMTVLWMLFIFLIRHATASHRNLSSKRCYFLRLHRIALRINWTIRSLSSFEIDSWETFWKKTPMTNQDYKFQYSYETNLNAIDIELASVGQNIFKTCLPIQSSHFSSQGIFHLIGWLVLICKWCWATFCKLQWGSIFRLLIGNVSCNFNLILKSQFIHIYIYMWLLLPDCWAHQNSSFNSIFSI